MDAYVIYANSRTCQYQRTLVHVCMQQGIKFTVVCHIISFFWYSDLILHRHTAIAGANKVTCPEIYINTTSSVFTAATCIRDPQQIAFVMLKGFYLLSNVPPPSFVLNKQYQDSWNTNQDQIQYKEMPALHYISNFEVPL